MIEKKYSPSVLHGIFDVVSFVFTPFKKLVCVYIWIDVNHYNSSLDVIYNVLLLYNKSLGV